MALGMVPSLHAFLASTLLTKPHPLPIFLYFPHRWYSIAFNFVFQVFSSVWKSQLVSSLPPTFLALCRLLLTRNLRLFTQILSSIVLLGEGKSVWMRDWWRTSLIVMLITGLLLCLQNSSAFLWINYYSPVWGCISDCANEGWSD